MDQRTFENSDRSNPQTMALPSRLIKIFFWASEACQGTSNRLPNESYIAQIAVKDFSFMKEFHT
jgi:hypothetical protein